MQYVKTSANRTYLSRLGLALLCAAALLATSRLHAQTISSSYTNTAFIRDFNSNFSVLVATNIPLLPGQPFSISLDMTADDPGHHVQWGFETIGPDANPTNAASLGQTLVSINPPTLSVGAAGSTINITIPSESGVNYAVQYRTNVTDATWQTLTVSPGNGTNLVVPDSTASGSRFYRASAQ